MFTTDDKLSVDSLIWTTVKLLGMTVDNKLSF